MAIRNRTALGIERLESRDTPTVTSIGSLGGGNAAVVLQQTTTGGDTEILAYQVVTPGIQVAYPVDPSVPGLFRAVQGGGDSVDA